MSQCWPAVFCHQPRVAKGGVRLNEAAKPQEPEQVLPEQVLIQAESTN